jgi:hypothetical protein
VQRNTKCNGVSSATEYELRRRPRCSGAPGDPGLGGDGGGRNYELLEVARCLVIKLVTRTSGLASFPLSLLSLWFRQPNRVDVCELRLVTSAVL